MLHTQANIRSAVVFYCVCAIANHQVCFRGLELYKNGYDTNISCSYFKRIMFGQDDIWLMYEQMRRLCFSE